MPRFHNTIEVDATPEQAWAVLGDLGQADKWIPGVTKVELDGTRERVCTFVDGHVQHEEISDYSDERRSYRYSIAGSPGMRTNRGAFSVNANGRGSVVLLDSEFEAIDPTQETQIATMWGTATKTVLESLRGLIERGSRD